MDNGQIVLEIKSLNEDGSFTGIASVYGVEDSYGDIIEKGAFTKTLQENPEIPLLWQHDDSEVIGKGTVTEQGGKVMISAQLDMEDSTAQKAYRKIKNKLVKGLSIGFQSIKRTFGEENGRYIRRIQELKLMEVSIVTFPALAQAQITQVKQRDELTERLASVESQLSALAAEKAAPAAPAKPEPVADHSAELAIARLRLSLLN
jgi:HK97 family phage prohead protease